MKEEKTINAQSGYVWLAVLITILATTITAVVLTQSPLYLLLLILVVFIAKGFIIVNPNSSKVLVLFGAYKGTIKKNGLFWVNPFYSKQKISLRARNFDSERKKVNDK